MAKKKKKKKNRGFLENFFEYYSVSIIANVNFFSDLKFEYYVSTTRKYYNK